MVQLVYELSNAWLRAERTAQVFEKVIGLAALVESLHVTQQQGMRRGDHCRAP